MLEAVPILEKTFVAGKGSFNMKVRTSGSKIQTFSYLSRNFVIFLWSVPQRPRSPATGIVLEQLLFLKLKADPPTRKVAELFFLKLFQIKLFVSKKRLAISPHQACFSIDVDGGGSDVSCHWDSTLLRQLVTKNTSRGKNFRSREVLCVSVTFAPRSCVRASMHLHFNNSSSHQCILNFEDMLVVPTSRSHWKIAIHRNAEEKLLRKVPATTILSKKLS